MEDGAANLYVAAADDGLLVSELEHVDYVCQLMNAMFNFVYAGNAILCSFRGGSWVMVLLLGDLHVAVKLVTDLLKFSSMDVLPDADAACRLDANCWTVDPGAWSLTMDGTPKWMLIMLVAGKALGWLVDPLGRNPEARALLPVFCDG
ncbi:hypothetical protein Nepgr_027737 [Nepenthes gracilis]|uniref:Uncharacterized protein n=1 Tax=Nepenthes gracilis TaxID=150966 RepID=A0AAD3TBG3_NEPGR|nr:hypothetical protein Nepgr_027737 [Nepenthes gracilis]